MTESRAVSVVLAVAMLLAGCIALIAFGPLAVNVLLTVAVAALILERSTIFARMQRAARRDLIARAAIRRRHDRELAEIRYYLQALDHVVRPLSEPVRPPVVMIAPEYTEDDSDLLVDEDPQQPITQPIILPTRGDGPPTEPADAVFVIAKAVGARQPADYQQTEPTREQKNAAWVESELSRFNFTGRNR